ncbi:SulP family inorganic anion transporter [Actinoplanes ianthinogenes]|uniref:SulP family inorganic anion transporter n=1 Tax=Actinoplanes ianthinogenes TaxID=122358 RepID=A0ABN6CN23_9ACTN|nr:SulP family inorganic anion transporter [Actinoplanes ianthinogenes]BCJ46536.1 SulP family inorganic anion transporter [Actinoplanes ianthinogenes]GGR34912.1 SulP family inorganic anion transporter [Actinoplanes ianthinogenes]
MAALLQGIVPYRRGWLRQDVVAGVTLAALAIPEVMGYTTIAGTPVITGLYTILLPAVVFGLLGSSRHLVVGGDSATAAIMYGGIAALGIAGLAPGSSQWLALASLTALICGVLLILARLVRLGFLADFISRTVLVGFLTGVGVQVAAGQIGGMLGVPAPKVDAGHLSGTLVGLGKTLGEIGQASGPTVAVSVAVLATLLVFGRWIKAVPGGLVAVVASIAVSYVADLRAHGVGILGPVPSGLPHLGFPSGVTWSDVGGLLGVSVSMFVVIIAQSAATSRAYAVRYRERFSANTDLVGLSLANVAAGLSSSFVVNGSPTKTEMVDEAKSRTQVAQLTMAVTVAVVLLFLTKPLQYLPTAVLSAVVFLIGLKLIDIAGMRAIWRLRRDEFWIALVTAAVVVGVGVEQGIVLAIVLSVLLHVRRHYAPVDTVVSLNAEGRLRLVPAEPGAVTEPGLVIYRFGVGLFYANAARLMEEALALVDVDPRPRWFVLLADAVDDLDYTGGQTLAELAENLAGRNVVFGVVAVTDHLREQLDRFGVTERIGAERVFATAVEARAAFRRADAAPGGPASGG